MTDTDRRRITEATAERLADLRIARRLRRDARYANAESAEAQAEAEAAIETAVWAELTAEYDIA